MRIRRNDFMIALTTALATACATAPDSAEAAGTMQQLLTDEPKSAYSYYQQLDLALQQDVLLSMLGAEAASRSGHGDVAIELYTRVAELTWPSMFRDPARFNLAIALMHADRWQEAYEALRKLPDDKQARSETVRALAIAAIGAGRIDDARRHFRDLPAADQQAAAMTLGRDFLDTQ